MTPVLKAHKTWNSIYYIETGLERLLVDLIVNRLSTFPSTRIPLRRCYEATEISYVPHGAKPKKTYIIDYVVKTSQKTVFFDATQCGETVLYM
jgi:hypothetical protein